MFRFRWTDRHFSGFSRFTSSYYFTDSHFFYPFVEISVDAADAYEVARAKVAAFVNAAEPREIVFTRNATEAINLVAYSWGLSNLKSGDEVIFPKHFCLFLVSLHLNLTWFCCENLPYAWSTLSYVCV